ncbi:MAG TPA: hypothetical protein DCE78_10180 [Bacteroidetes bacterium]|nr:hypothetical protein [Bacteroidota bacterium]
MRNNIVDLIVYLARKIRLGESLIELKDDSISKFNKSEISAAYSWIMQQYPRLKSIDDLKTDNYSITNQVYRPDDILPGHRVLHYAERILITPDAYGYLLELVEIGIIDQKTMESIIERVMFHTTDRITIESVKTMIQENLFENQKSSKVNNSFLRGNESVN